MKSLTIALIFLLYAASVCGANYDYTDYDNMESDQRSLIWNSTDNLFSIFSADNDGYYQAYSSPGSGHYTMFGNSTIPDDTVGVKFTLAKIDIASGSCYNTYIGIGEREVAHEMRNGYVLSASNYAGNKGLLRYVNSAGGVTQLADLGYTVICGSVGTWKELIFYTENNQLIMIYDGTVEANVSIAAYVNITSDFRPWARSTNDNSFSASWAINSTEMIVVGEPPPPSDPPVIDDSTLNLTSDNCIKWRTDKGDACYTEDSTPTISFDTDVAANCRMGVSDLNYTGLGSGRNCTTTGATSHICTLAVSDILSSGASNLYAGCETLTGIENATSSSGSLAVNLAYLFVGTVKEENNVAVGNASVNIVYQNNFSYFATNLTTNASGQWNAWVYNSTFPYIVWTFDPNNISRGPDIEINITVP